MCSLQLSTPPPYLRYGQVAQFRYPPLKGGSDFLIDTINCIARVTTPLAFAPLNRDIARSPRL